MELTDKEIERYGRHLLLPEIGQVGQLKLKSAKVLIVGVGGLGSPAAIYLSAAGVGTLGLVDYDRVEYPNLQRQVIHFTKDVKKSKVKSAKKKITQINPHVKVHLHEGPLNAQNALDIIKKYDLVIDGTDNFPSRYLINDACIFLKKPDIFGAIHRFEGQCSVFGFEDGPCYRCLFQEPPAPGEIPSCAEAGVLGVLPGLIGLLQVNEAIKIICEIGQPLKGRLLMVDALTVQFREIQIKKDPNCALCGTKRTIHTLVEYAPICAELPASSAQSQPEAERMEISVKELKQIMDSRPKDFYLLDVRELKEWQIAHIEGAVLKPFSTFKEDYQDIPKEKKIYVHCKVGGRSMKVVHFLKSQGYSQCFNIKGGIDSWAKEIDHSMPTY